MIFKKATERIHQLFPRPQQEVIHIIFTDDDEIQKLNACYRHKDCPTDVLAFSYHAPDLLGEIYISVETTRRQAKTYRWKYVNELNKIFIHGFLHLKGYSHELKADASKMKSKENDILRFAKIK